MQKIDKKNLILNLKIMSLLTPKGLNIKITNDNKVSIATDKKELVFSDYLAVFICCFGLAMLFFFLVEEGFNEYNISFSIFFLTLLGFIFISLILSFKEFQTIIITPESIEIYKKRLIFSAKIVLEKGSIEKIDLKELKYPTNVVIMFKAIFNLGNYQIPRIVYRGREIFIFEHYKKDIRIWIIDYLNSFYKIKKEIN